LLINVLHVSHPAALVGSTRYAREIVDGFFRRHTSIDLSHIEPRDKFCNLKVESRLEIAFVGRPKGLKIPHYNFYRYELSEGFAVVFEVETQLIKRYITPYSEFDLVEVQRRLRTTNWVYTAGGRHASVICKHMRLSGYVHIGY
jgi:hypothetical protein